MTRKQRASLKRISRYLIALQKNMQENDVDMRIDKVKAPEIVAEELDALIKEMK